MKSPKRSRKTVTPATRQIRRPVQSRSIATVEALLEAAARILSKEGFEQFTTNRVAKVAGVGVGSLYEYFSDKREIITVLTERFAAEIEDRVTHAIRAQDGADIGTALAAVLDIVVEIYLSRAELHRTLLHQVPYLSKANPLSVIEQPIREALADMFRNRSREMIIEDHEIAAIYVSRICRGLVDAAHADPFMPLDVATVKGELVVICRRYLTGRP